MINALKLVMGSMFDEWDGFGEARAIVDIEAAINYYRHYDMSLIYLVGSFPVFPLIAWVVVSLKRLCKKLFSNQEQER